LVFGHFDSTANASTDPNAGFLAFSLVDNVRVIDPCLGDIEPPTITPPADIIVPATSPDGAVVTYSVTATDNCPNPVSLVCEPAAGGTFPIGVNTVVCMATDAAGNTALSSFTVTVKGAPEQITELIALVRSLSLEQGTENSLRAKLEGATASLSYGNGYATCGKLSAFMHEVSAQAGKNITQNQADLLILEANRIRAVIGC
jgi:hypothetical protein